MSDIVERWILGGYAPGDYYGTCSTCGHGIVGDKRSTQCLHCAAKWAANEIERLRAALKEIVNLTERPSSLYPLDWEEQIAACPDCQRYKNHPIQRGICDLHRKPIYATEAHDAHETRILGYRAKDIARAALTST